MAASNASGLNSMPHRKRVAVDIGVDRQVKRARLDVGNKNRLIGSEVRNPQSAKEWFALPEFLLLALVIYGQLKRIAKAV